MTMIIVVMMVTMMIMIMEKITAYGMISDDSVPQSWLSITSQFFNVCDLYLHCFLPVCHYLPAYPLFLYE